MGKLAKRVALVTGGGRGIGRAIALAFAREGADLAVADLDGAALAAVAREIKDLGRRCLALTVDVSKEEQVGGMVDAALREFGRIDILVNNAAVIGPTSPLVDISREEWDAVLANNLTSAFLCSKAILRHMIAAGGGKIINIASVAGRIAYPLRCPYAVSKWGLIGLTRTLAQEVGVHNIQVNAVCPGPVAGERMRRVIRERAARLGRPDEEVEREFVEAAALKRMVAEKDVAAVVLFLAADEGGSITGQAIGVDGGYAL